MLLPIPPLDNITNATGEERTVLEDMNRYLLNQLVVRRNRKMSRRLHALLSSSRNITYFIALGAGNVAMVSFWFYGVFVMSLYCGDIFNIVYRRESWVTWLHSMSLTTMLYTLPDGIPLLWIKCKTNKWRAGMFLSSNCCHGYTLGLIQVEFLHKPNA